MDNNLQDLDDRRVALNRRIGIYSIWIILFGVGIAMFFFGEGLDPTRRWGILGLVAVYVAVRLALMRYKRKRRGDKVIKDGSVLEEKNTII